jgi:hypothetical protein
VEKAHDVTEVRFEGDRIVLVVDGKKHVIALSVCSRKLLGASKEARKRFVVSSCGYGIHWPDLDEDLSVDRLIGGAKKQPPFKTAKRGKTSGERPDGPTPG